MIAFFDAAVRLVTGWESASFTLIVYIISILYAIPYLMIIFVLYLS
jgi:hypothetical protein